jgi:dienelactone hydrolase
MKKAMEIHLSINDRFAWAAQRALKFWRVAKIMLHTKPRTLSALTYALLAILIHRKFVQFSRSFSPTCPFRRHELGTFFSRIPISNSIVAAMDARSSISTLSWTPLKPSNFEQTLEVSNSQTGCRYAKDERYLEAVLEAWNREDSAEDPPIETSSYVYEDSEKALLYGRLVRPSRVGDGVKRAGVMLFHTAAGPQDIFLFYIAYALAKELNCIVLICDILSDPDGWAWGSDRTHYNQVRQDLAKDDHRMLRCRVEAAIRAMLREEQVALGVDYHRLAMMGWCLGGQPILEVPRIRIADFDFSLRAMATFHGVFHRETPLSMLTTNDNRNQQECRLLICTGRDDPFVSQEDLQSAKGYFEGAGWLVDIVSMKEARHGYTNPAQAFNDNGAFNYNESAARISWEMAMRMFQECLS